MIGELRYKDKLKHDGHDLIDELVALGINRRQVYSVLAKRLSRPEPGAHFEKVRTVRELEPMVQELRQFRDERLKARPHKLRKKKKNKLPGPAVVVTPKPDQPKRKFKNECLPREQALPLIREVAKANARKPSTRIVAKLSWWERVLLWAVVR